MRTFWKEAGAEGIGTFSLTFAGCTAIVVNDLYGGLLGHVGISMVFGLVVMAMIYSIGNISGAHINPAVTLGFFFTGQLRAAKLAPYITAQLIGALAAGHLMLAIFPAHDALGSTVPADSVSRAFAMEGAFTFLLMFVILNVSTGHMEKGIMAGVAVGGTVALAALTGGPVSGASMNPARSIGPAAASGTWNALWLYVVAPVMGALAAGPVYRFIQSPGASGAEGRDS